MALSICWATSRTSANESAFVIACVIGVLVGPGLTRVTRTPVFANLCWSPWAYRVTSPFAAP